MPNVFEMDNKAWDVIVTDLKQTGTVVDTDKTKRTLSGEMMRDIVGTFYNYTLKVCPKNNNLTEFDTFFTEVLKPIASHSITMPHNQGTLSFNAYVTSAERNLIRMYNNYNKWGPITINFIAMAPNYES